MIKFPSRNVELIWPPVNYDKYIPTPTEIIKPTHNQYRAIMNGGKLQHFGSDLSIFYLPFFQRFHDKFVLIIFLTHHLALTLPIWKKKYYYVLLIFFFLKSCFRIFRSCC